MSEPLPRVHNPSHAIGAYGAGMRSRARSEGDTPSRGPRRRDSITAAYIHSHSYIASLSNLGRRPQKGRLQPKGATMFQAAVNTTKLVVGVGSFALPQAFELAGMAGGILGIPLLAAWCAFSMKLMVDVRLDIGPQAVYYDVGRETFGKWLEVLMYGCAIFASVGAAAGYLDFLAPLLLDIFEVTISHADIVALASPVFIVLCWIRSFRYMAFTSVLGDVAFVLAMTTVFVYGFMNETPDFSRPALVTESYPDFLGAAVFLYGICLFVMPQQNTMQKPSDFMPSVYASFAVTTVLNVFFGAVGYALWGTAAKGVIIYNLQGGIFPKLVKILLTLDLTFSFPVVMSPARELTERFVLGRSPPSDWCTEWKRNLIRALLVGAAAVLAVGVKSFLSMIGLVSGLALIATALVFPPLCYWKRFHVKREMSLLFQGFLLVLICVGIAAAAFTTFLAAQKVRKSFEHQHS